MINFFTILTKESGMGNYFRMYEIYKILLDIVPVRFYLYTDGDFEGYIASDVIELKISNEINLKDCDLLVYDFPFLDSSLERYFDNLSIKKTVGLNDATVNKLKPDLYFNTDNIIDSSNINKAYTGLEYQIIRGDLIKKLSLNNEIKTIGVMFGGSDPGEINSLFLKKVISEKSARNYQFIIIVPSSKLHNYTAQLPDYINVITKPDIPKFYSNIDILVNMGGMSSYEAMYVGVPVFSLEWNYMAIYVKKLEKLGLVWNLGLIDKGYERLIDLLENKSAKEITLKANNAQMILDGQGAKRICDKILEFLGE